MSIDSRIVTSLNSWGASHKSIVHIISNDFVYIAILLAGLWIVVETFKAQPRGHRVAPSVRGLIANGLVMVAFPIGLTVIISELVSKVYVRQRPFVTLPDIKLLVPHSADGGMPSHHLAFMTALVVSVYFYDRRSAALFAVLALLSATGRVAAGIHYPSDILAGVALAIAIVFFYRWIVIKFFSTSILEMRS